MKKIILTLCFFANICLADTIANTKDFPACNFKEQGVIAFSTLEPTDTLKVSVKGNPCYKARLNIEILNSKGRMLYFYSADFNKHVITHWNEPSLPEDAKKLVKDIVAGAVENPKYTSDLPIWQEPEEYENYNFSTIKISKTKYEKIREERHIIFSHSTHYEEWKAVIFNSKTGKAELLLYGGV